MLINSIKTLAFKPIDFLNKTSPLLNLKTTYCDTFERSSDYAISNPISFGMASDKVLKNLDEEGKYACSVLGLTNKQVGQYRSIAGNYPNLSPMQIALCAKAKLEDERIEQYATIVSNSIKYIDDNEEEKEWQIPADEAIFCIKENFNDEQLKRYAQLRNRIVDLKDKSVRGTGKTHNLRPQYVLNAVKENKTDEQIQFEELFYEGIVKYGFNSLEAQAYAKLNPEQRKVYGEIIEKGYRIWFIRICYTELTPEQRKAFDEAMGKGCGEYAAIDYAKLNPEQRKAYIKAMEKGHNIFSAISYAKLNSEQRKACDEAIEKGYNKSIAINYAKLNPEQRKAYIKAKGKGYGAINYAKLNPEQRKAYIKAMGKGYDEFSAIDYAKLTSEQRKAYIEAMEKGYDEFSAIDYAKLTSEQRKAYIEAMEKGYGAISYAKLTSEQRKGFNEAMEKGYDELTAIDYARLNTQQRKIYLNLIEQDITSHTAYYLAEAGITSLTPEMLEQLPDNIWYLIQTGENKETHDTIQNAIKLCLNPPIEFDEHRVKVRDIQDLELHSKLNRKGFLEHNNSQFVLELQKTTVNNQPVLIVKDTNSEDKFVAYKGAIAYVAPLSIIDEEKTQQEMKTHSNLLPEKQAQILTRAIREFVFDITDNDGGCIISKGLEGIIPVDSTVKEDDIRTYTGNNKTTKETEEHYLRLIETLDKQNQFNAKNLLRMFPEDAILSINPYAIKTDKSNILYSISAEWKDKEGKHWEMRIHSTDLSDLNGATTADKWVFRLGYKIENEGGNNEKHYLRKYKDNNGNFCYDMNGKYKGNDSKDSHIEFISPLEQNSLLNNIDFQKDIRNISAALYGENEINEICSEIFSPEELKSLQKKGFYEKAGAVIKYAMENPVFYYFKQEYIDKLRAILKLPDLSAI